METKQDGHDYLSASCRTILTIMIERMTYLFTLGPALGRGGSASLFGGTVSVAAGSHSEGGGLGNAGERGSGDTEERHFGYGFLCVKQRQGRDGSNVER